MNKKINKDTQVCISISERPGKLGSIIHNTAYEALGLNFIYKAFAVTNLEGAMAGVRALGIRGCSVSMPFKEKIITLLDKIDETAKEIGAVNTVVNEQGCLVGYNTDAIGMLKVFENLNLDENESVLILGAGGMARAVAYALSKKNLRSIFVANRNSQRIDGLQKIISCTTVEWQKRNDKPVKTIINTTSIGMAPEIGFMPVSEAMIQQAKTIIDVVVSPAETLLIKTAKSFGKKTVSGVEITIEQALRQFSLYTKNEAPREVVEKAIADQF